MVLMEGGGTADVEDRLRHNWWATLVTNWQVWPAFQFVNFYVVPVQFRLLAVNVVSIAWNCFLSLRNGSKRKEDEKPVHNPPVPV
ncbi:unnamed protein product [Kuraishia capsulata CBS 1993]|uniref:Protein SYM1 n=1 Tax=Kuraishia capsulata CBS 1993 TaxID=1382522 RepID=W6MQL8_9ASCO|nr:uncharacterized protein KUCA_T00004617001 [Kuraishia capsulata CBS 1993]CDK28633.1 unnamed protein product [Kuraishia capsulata CBS 1993]